MSRALEEVAREAIELSQEERLVLARILLEGCDLPGYPINEAEQTWEKSLRTEYVLLIQEPPKRALGKMCWVMSIGVLLDDSYCSG